jgi:hypothetical protein
MWSILRGLLGTRGSTAAIARSLESAAAAAYTCEKAIRGHC